MKLKEYIGIEMKTLAILLIHIIGLNTSVTSNAQNFEGTWSASINTADGLVDVIYQFEEDGENVSGTAFLPNGTFPIAQGSINGNTISFVIKYGDISVFHTGYYLREQLLMSTSYQGNSGQLTLNRVSE